MRALFIGILAATSLATLAHAQISPTTGRDCLKNENVGAQPASSPAHPNAHYFYITSVMVGNHKNGRYGNSGGGAVAVNSKDACDQALKDIYKYYPVKDGWSVTGATVALVPDGNLKQGLAH